jgi:hypothetical protein
MTFPFDQDLVKQFSVGHPGAEEGGGGTGSLFANFLSALVDIIIEIPVRWVMGIPRLAVSVSFSVIVMACP